MEVHTLIRKLVLHGSPATVFEFFGNPANLTRLVPQWVRFQLLTSMPLSVRRGLLIEYLARPLLLPIRWIVLVNAVHSPHSIVVEQVRGPFAKWSHTRELRRVKSGTEVLDTIRYAMPFGPFGRLLHETIIRRALEHILEYGTGQIQAAFTPAGQAVTSGEKTRQ